MNNILTCIDGSAHSADVYNYAGWAAQRLNGPVELLHVIEHYREHAVIYDLSGAIGVDASMELTEELTRLEETQSKIARLKGKAILEEAAKHLRNAGVQEVKITQRNGSLVETVLEFEKAAQLLVLGKKGEVTGSSRMQLGQHVQELVRLSVCPVLISAKPFREIRRFIVAFDDSNNARKAIEYLCGSPLLRGLECLVLMVGHADEAHKQALEQATAKLNAAGYKAGARSLPGNPATVIAEEARQASTDLLVMGAYGHSKLREFFLGSTTTRLVQASSSAILLFR